MKIKQEIKKVILFLKTDTGRLWVKRAILFIIIILGLRYVFYGTNCYGGGSLSDAANYAEEATSYASDAYDYARKAYNADSLEEAQDYAYKAMSAAEDAESAANSAKDAIEEMQ